MTLYLAPAFHKHRHGWTMGREGTAIVGLCPGADLYREAPLRTRKYQKQRWAYRIRILQTHLELLLQLRLLRPCTTVKLDIRVERGLNVHL